jgi:protein subunit release factor A
MENKPKKVKLEGPWPNSVTKADLRIEFYRGSGPGGQHRNKKDTACRITHIPTGIAATAQEFKSQKQNKEAAFRRLAEKLVPLMRKALATTKIENDSDKLLDRIRTYKEKPNTVIDKRTETLYNMNKILDGELEKLINEIKELL